MGYKSNQACELLRGIISQMACRNNYEDETIVVKKTFYTKYQYLYKVLKLKIIFIIATKIYICLYKYIHQLWL